MSENVFDGCSLKYVELKCKQIESWFKDSDIKELVIGESVRKINAAAFSGCSMLESVSILSNDLLINADAFSGCPVKNAKMNCKQNGVLFKETLETVVIGDNITFIENNAFKGYSKLESVSIPGSVTAIGISAFQDCISLKSISIPNTVTVIGESAFQGCSSLTSILIPSSVATIGTKAFSGCTNLASISISENTTTIGAQAFQSCKMDSIMLNCEEIGDWFKESDIKKLVVGQSVRKISNEAFSGCKFLESVSILSSNITIGDNVFYGCPVKYAQLNCRQVNNWFNASLEKVILCDNVLSIGERAFYGCSKLMSISIPNSVTEIGKSAFYGCGGLVSVNIPNSVTTIDEAAFENCGGLKSMAIPKNVKTVEKSTFMDCRSLTSVSFPQGLISIKESAFKGCSSLKDVTIPQSVETIDKSAFNGCIGLGSVSLSTGLICIGDSAFAGCTGLKSISIPVSVTDIGKQAFAGCNSTIILYTENIGTWFKGSDIKALVIGENVKTIYQGAFSGCSSLESVSILSTNVVVGEKAFYGCPVKKAKLNCKQIGSWFNAYLEDVSMGDSVMTIGYSAFKDYYSLKSISISNNVANILTSAFAGCRALTSVVVPNSVTNIGESVFQGCTNLTSIKLSNEIKTISNYMFKGCSSLTSISIPNNVRSIGTSAFEGCGKLTSVTLPNSLTYIDNNAFYYCYSLASVILPDNITYIGSTAFSTNCLRVNRSTVSLLTLWKNGYVPYETGNENMLVPPQISILSTTQTTANLKIRNWYEGYSYTISFNGESFVVDDTEFLQKGLKPETKYSCTLRVTLDNQSYTNNSSFMTNDITPYISSTQTVTTITLYGTYLEGDANVASQKIVFNGKTIEGDEYTAIGLDPNKSYTAKYVVEVNNENGDNWFYNKEITVKTNKLVFTSEQPKVITVGNVVVTTQTNLENTVTNVGFEWRRTDWTSEFASNTGQAYLYNGEMQGYIRNLYIEKLWKFRPYFISESGNYYYGEWVGIDPTNTSYFEPTVHTYADIQTDGNSAIVKGYVQRGTDNITVQGFKYWQNTNAPKVRSGDTERLEYVPEDAMTVTAKGQVMVANIKNLHYGTKYSYTAFVETSEGEIFYGEEQSFTTDGVLKGDMDGDGKITVDDITLLIAVYLNETKNVHADMDGDGHITVDDITYLISIYLETKK